MTINNEVIKFENPELQAVYGDMVPAVFDGRATTKPNVITQLVDNPDFVMKRNLALGIDRLPLDVDRYAGVLKDLGKYGINSPGFVVLGLDEDPQKEYFMDHVVFTATDKVHGDYIRPEHIEGIKGINDEIEAMRKVPETKTVEAMTRILDYYDAVADGKIDQYTPNVYCGNLMFGKRRGEAEEQLYLFGNDYGATWYDSQTASGLHGAINITSGPSYDGGTSPFTQGLSWDIKRMRHAYETRYPELEAQRDEINTRLTERSYDLLKKEQSERNKA